MACGTTDIEQVALRPTGSVVARTTVADLQVGEVRLDDGVLVMGRIDADGSVCVGTRVVHVPDDHVVRFVVDA
jgi:hypothetical protein